MPEAINVRQKLGLGNSVRGVRRINPVILHAISREVCPVAMNA